SSDYVLVYQGNTSLRDGDITGLSLHFFTSVSIDIRTLASRERLFEVLNEVHRILWNKMLSLPNYEVLDLHDARFVDLSDKSVGLWRIVYDIKLKKISEVRG
ncbi:MAG: hypothetical protein N3F05_05060, partial [Candidatus Diapherotrites archaeon]|nr:hypothetical protein [Candidatus Diapherotrites archaeon]